MKFLTTILMLQLTLIGCQKSKSKNPNDLEWKNQGQSNINNEPTFEILNCRSLETVKDHHYLEAYMKFPTEQDYSQNTNSNSEVITFIPNVYLYTMSTHTNGNNGTYDGQYLTNSSLRITGNKKTNTYRFEFIANDETVNYFSNYGGDPDLKNIKLNETFIEILKENNNFKVIKVPSSVYASDNFTCQNSNPSETIY